MTESTHHVDDLDIETVEGQTWGFALVSMILLLVVGLYFCCKWRKSMTKRSKETFFPQSIPTAAAYPAEPCDPCDNATHITVHQYPPKGWPPRQQGGNQQPYRAFHATNSVHQTPGY